MSDFGGTAPGALVLAERLSDSDNKEMMPDDEREDGSHKMSGINLFNQAYASLAGLTSEDLSQDFPGGTNGLVFVAERLVAFASVVTRLQKLKSEYGSLEESFRKLSGENLDLIVDSGCPYDHGQGIRDAIQSCKKQASVCDELLKGRVLFPEDKSDQTCPEHVRSVVKARSLFRGLEESVAHVNEMIKESKERFTSLSSSLDGVAGDHEKVRRDIICMREKKGGENATMMEELVEAFDDSLRVVSNLVFSSVAMTNRTCSGQEFNMRAKALVWNSVVNDFLKAVTPGFGSLLDMRFRFLKGCSAEVFRSSLKSSKHISCDLFGKPRSWNGRAEFLDSVQTNVGNRFFCECYGVYSAKELLSDLLKIGDGLDWTGSTGSVSVNCMFPARFSSDNKPSFSHYTQRSISDFFHCNSGGHGDSVELISCLWHAVYVLRFALLCMTGHELKEHEGILGQDVLDGLKDHYLSSVDSFFGRSCCFLCVFG